VTGARAAAIAVMAEALAAKEDTAAAAVRTAMAAVTAVRAAAAVRATRRAVAATLLVGDLESSHTAHVKASEARVDETRCDQRENVALSACCAWKPCESVNRFRDVPVACT